MTITQMMVATETAKTGSVTAAARALGMSQPNASHILSQLEEELGFPVFTRGRGGAAITEKGARYLESATKILREHDAILMMGKNGTEFQLRLGTMHYTPAIDAFIDICRVHSHEEKVDTVCVMSTLEKAVPMIALRRMDVFACVLRRDQMTDAESLAEENHLSLIRIARKQLCVRMRKDHPALTSGEIKSLPRDMEALEKYPYVEYMQMEKMVEDYNQTHVSRFGCRYRILVEDRETRLRIVGNTDAYELGCEMLREREEEFGIVSIPIESIPASTVCCLVRNGEGGRAEITEYINCLKKRMGEIDQ